MEPISKGGQGQVLRAHRKSDGRMCALKLFEREEDAITEASIMQHENLMCHDNIIRMLQIMPPKCIAYEMGGEDLHNIMTNSPWNVVPHIVMNQCASAVSHIHSLGIIHRDLKLENITVCNDLRVKIIDFGLSVRFQPGEVFTCLVGSKSYAAPEILKRCSYDHKIDLWSLGIVAFATYVGHFPFDYASSSCLAFKAMYMMKEHDAKTTVVESHFSYFKNATAPLMSPVTESLIDRLLSLKPGMRPEAADVKFLH